MVSEGFILSFKAILMFLAQKEVLNFLEIHSTLGVRDKHRNNKKISIKQKKVS